VADLLSRLAGPLQPLYLAASLAADGGGIAFHKNDFLAFIRMFPT
jgi:hypothetical protein